MAWASGLVPGDGRLAVDAPLTVIWTSLDYVAISESTVGHAKSTLTLGLANSTANMLLEMQARENLPCDVLKLLYLYQLPIPNHEHDEQRQQRQGTSILVRGEQGCMDRDKRAAHLI